MIMKKYILSIDQGTTSSRAILFNHQAEVVAIAQKEFTQYFPHSGWVEHNAKEIWSSQLAVCIEVIELANIHASEIAAIGITNQRETTIVWNKETGEPVYNAIVWQDRRTAEYCDNLKQQGYGEVVRQKTGLVLDPYFSATKIRWILDHIENGQKLADEGKLAFGTIDSWLLYKLTNGKYHATDVSNASRSLLFNIDSLQWDDELLHLFNIPKTMLPEVKNNTDLFGTTDKMGNDSQIPIHGMAGDQQAALFGQMCIEPGMVKNTYGTGCFMVLNTGDKIITSRNNLLSTVAWSLGNTTIYAIEGSIFIGGAIIQWLRDGLGIIKSSDESEKMALSVNDNGGVVFVPAFTGLGAPYWDPYARGLMIGITRGTNTGHIVRAALESIAFQCKDVLQAMENDMGHQALELRVDGGATSNNLLMQFQSDIMNLPVVRPEIQETTAMGAAFFAGLGCGFWSSIDQLKSFWKESKRFTPNLDQDDVQKIIEKWHLAVQRSSGWGKY